MRNGSKTAGRTAARAAGVLGVLMMATVVQVGGARANDYVVDTSNVPAYKPEDKIAKGTRIVVPDGGKLTLIDRTGPSPKQRACAGKYEGPIDACPAQAAGAAPKFSPGATRGATR